MIPVKVVAKIGSAIWGIQKCTKTPIAIASDPIPKILEINTAHPTKSQHRNQETVPHRLGTIHVPADSHLYLSLLQEPASS